MTNSPTVFIPNGTREEIFQQNKYSENVKPKPTIGNIGIYESETETCEKDSIFILAK